MDIKHFILVFLFSTYVIEAVSGHACFGDRMKACKNGQCIAGTFFCNGQNDCGDWSDEFNCPSQKLHGEKCPQNTFQCNTSGEEQSCIPLTWLCDGMSDCLDSRDELNCTSRAECKDGWKCGRECIDMSWVCDGIDDCSDSSDEKQCGFLREKEWETAFETANGNGTVFTRRMDDLVLHFAQALDDFQEVFQRLLATLSNPCLTNPCNNGLCSVTNMTSYACYCPRGTFVASIEPFNCKSADKA